MNEIMLHPDRDFLNPRNPSSPFAARLAAANSVWAYIEEDIVTSKWHMVVGIKINKKRYLAFSKKELFDLIKHHWGI